MKHSRWLLGCGAVAGPLFVVVFLIEGATRADYNTVRHPVSSLALGDFGWMQVANFLVTGSLIVCFAVGLWRILHPSKSSTLGPLFIGAVGVGLIGAGVFPSDPVSGYPAGTPDKLEYTTLGALHDIFSVPVFVGLPLACFVFARLFVRRREFGGALYSVASGVGMFVTFLLASLGFSQDPNLVDYGGIYQRISLLIGFGWLTLLAVWFLRGSHTSA